MATKTIPKQSDRRALEKQLHDKLQQVIDSGDEGAIEAVTAFFSLLKPRLKRKGGGA